MANAIISVVPRFLKHTIALRVFRHFMKILAGFGIDRLYIYYIIFFTFVNYQFVVKQIKQYFTL